MSDDAYDYEAAGELAEKVMRAMHGAAALYDPLVALNAITIVSVGCLAGALKFKPEIVTRLNEQLHRCGAPWELVPSRLARH